MFPALCSMLHAYYKVSATMSDDVVISVENLSKRYRIGAKEEGYKTFREAIIDGFKAPFRNFMRLRNLTKFEDSTSKEQGVQPYCLSRGTRSCSTGAFISMPPAPCSLLLAFTSMLHVPCPRLHAPCPHLTPCPLLPAPCHHRKAMTP